VGTIGWRTGHGVDSRTMWVAAEPLPALSDLILNPYI